jgi:hypothetical protein
MQAFAKEQQRPAEAATLSIYFYLERRQQQQQQQQQKRSLHRVRVFAPPPRRRRMNTLQMEWRHTGLPREWPCVAYTRMTAMHPQLDPTWTDATAAEYTHPHCHSHLEDGFFQAQLA